MTIVKETIASGHKMVRDANLHMLADTIGCKLQGASSDLQKTLATVTLTPPAILMGRQQTILYLRAHKPVIANKWDKHFKRLAEIEAEIAPFFRKDGKDKDSLEDDSIGQLSFQHTLLKPLNQVPWALLVIAMFKVWVVPAMSVLLPLMVWIIPYILLRFVYALPISQDQYMTILQHLLSGNMSIPNLDAVPVEGATGGFTMKTVFQGMMFAFTFLQSMIQPIQNAMHLYKTDAVCVKIGRQILEVRKIVQELRADIGSFNGIHVKLSFGLDPLPESDVRRAFIVIKEYPENIHMTFRDLAHVECLWRIAMTDRLNPIVFTRNALVLNDCHDISLKGVAVTSSIEMVVDAKPHAVLTGPNGGGKSSFLRAALQAVLLGHAFGFAPAKRAFMPRFTWIASGLQLRDTPGSLSMFETEVKFAAECIRNAKRYGPGLVLFDELFHSTNPPDGVRTAGQFLHRLWKQKDLFTIVSTHVFSLVEAAPSNVQAVCCPAVEGENGDITYSYGLQPGMCKVSSVHTVWEKFGLAKRSARSGSHRQTLPAKEKD